MWEGEVPRPGQRRTVPTAPWTTGHGTLRLGRPASRACVVFALLVSRVAFDTRNDLHLQRRRVILRCQSPSGSRTTKVEVGVPGRRGPGRPHGDGTQAVPVTKLLRTSLCDCVAIPYMCVRSTVRGSKAPRRLKTKGWGSGAPSLYPIPSGSVRRLVAPVVVRPPKSRRADPCLRRRRGLGIRRH